MDGEAYGLLLPIQTGKTSQVLDLMEALEQPGHRQELAACCRRLWLERMIWHLATCPRGDLLIGFLLGVEAGSAFERLLASADPFDRFLVSRLADVSGIDIARGIGPAERIVPLLDVRTR